MGYCSDIHVITSVEGFEKMRECIWKLAEDRKLSDNMVLFPRVGEDPEKFFHFFEQGGDYIHFGFSSFKWSGFYKDVALFLDMLAEVDEEEVAWSFCRNGQDSDDFEIWISEAEDYDMPCIELRPVVCW